ncbi:MAG: hypothetical protein Q7T41_03475, partial [Candidatus Saccharibacteria bacterium]|nr:hypothetical protein [Candidatus Saccharibacteria bacterium]
MGVQEKTKSSEINYNSLFINKNNIFRISTIIIGIFIFIGYFSGIARALNYEYTYTVGGTTFFDIAYGNATDSSGNVYTVGNYRGTNVDFNTTGTGSPDLKTASARNTYINKINSNGTYGYTYTVSASSSSALGVAVDSSDNIYFAGWFMGSNVDFNTTGTGSPDLHTSVAGGTVSSA